MKKNTLVPMLFTSMKSYSAQQLLKDIISGIIVAIIALPLSIALALASGVGPEVGIYTAIIGGFLIAFFGGSTVQIAGPTAAFATIVAGIVATSGMNGLIVATLIAGILLVIMGICGVGALIKYIPATITIGFTAGIAVTIAIGQVKDFLGLTYQPGTANIETVEKVLNIVKNISTINWWALLVGAVCLLILILWPKVSKKIPGSLIAVIVGVCMVKFLKLPVNTIGDLYTITPGFPSLKFPELSWSLITGQFGNGFTIAILAAIESLLSCVVADGMVGTKHRSNMELVGQGIGNIGCALFGGIPATGAIARTAANIKNGGRTPIAGIVHSVVLVLVLLFLMPYASWIPMPAIAAILFSVAYNMSGIKNISSLLKCAPKMDIIVFALTFILTIVFDLVVAIEVGMVAACVLFMKRMADETKVQGWKYRNVMDDSDAVEENLRTLPEYIRVFEITGPLFFGAAEKIDSIEIKDFTKVLILRMRAVNAIDHTAMSHIMSLYNKCKDNGVTLVLSHMNEQPLEMLKHEKFIDLIGEDNVCVNIDAAIERAYEVGAKA